MKKTFTKLFLTLTSVLTTLGVVNAQINAGSVVPVDFLVNSPATIAAEYAYGTQTETWGPELTQTVTGDLIWSYDVNGDSTLCEDAVTDLTGKMALIRRGGCFSARKFGRPNSVELLALSSATIMTMPPKMAIT